MILTQGANVAGLVLTAIALGWLLLVLMSPPDSRTLGSPRQGIKDFLYGMFWLIVVLLIFM